ncbi:MAG: GNAT family N-acetyltransferase [Actinomycetota bacterium]|nr:GNAT family N-acetyltransferase [Actinomycetota bacterium]
MRIFEITTRDGFECAFPVMRGLRDHLDEKSYFAYLDEMIDQGYRLYAREDAEGRIVALAGVARRTNFYYGRYIWVYDLVTSEGARSAGHGRALLEHLEDLARHEGLDTIALSSGLQRKDAHRFYEERVGFERTSYAFVKRLR